MKASPTRGFRHLTTVDRARRRLLKSVQGSCVKETVRVQLQDAVGRVLAKRIIASSFLPAFDVSVVDGYAVRSRDVRRASPKNRVVLRIVGESRLGELCRLRIHSEESVVVATGSSLPKGCDAVVMVENADRLDAARVAFHTPIGVWLGITRKGDDMKPGSLVLERRGRLRPEDVGALRALGMKRVQVLRRVRVGILSTGNELVNVPNRGNCGKIVDLNRPILSAMVRELGANPVDLGIAKDDAHIIGARLKAGLRKADVVLVTAGSSVGKRDLVPDCINRLGNPGMLVHGVAMRPALPTGLAVVKGKPVISLPGFPVSAMIAFRTFVRPLLAKLGGAPEPVEPTIRAVLREGITGFLGHRTFVRVRVWRGKGGYEAVPLRAQRSSQLSSMVGANGIVTVSEEARPIEAGSTVAVTLIGDIRN